MVNLRKGSPSAKNRFKNFLFEINFVKLKPHNKLHLRFLMSKFIYKLYEILPKNLVNGIGKSSLLKPVRDRYLRSDKGFKSIEVRVSRDYLDYHVEFKFNASIKTAEKAGNRGIENTLLRNSIRLISKKTEMNNPVLFDIGANFGYLSLVWANTICKKGIIYSFEPNPSVYDCFRKSVSVNHLEKIIKHHNFAVGRESGTAEFHFAETSSNIISDINSNSNISIKIISVDDFAEENKIDRCDMIKIDVDGIEYEILNGAAKTIDKFKPLLIIETNEDQKILDFIFDKHYNIFDMKLNKVNPGDEIPANIFCVFGDSN